MPEHSAGGSSELPDGCAEVYEGAVSAVPARGSRKDPLFSPGFIIC